ncbi:MAG: GFA family protein [Moraxellaceae bacterium]|nr:GFA family protein [Moraxellaceae bacterium]
MQYKGSCHCGKVAFEVDGEIDGALSCNCSMCQRRGSLLWFVPREKLRLLTPDDAASTYTFNKHKIRHRFCPDCGIHAWGEATTPAGKPMAAINIRCLEDIALAEIQVVDYDGRAL